MSGAVNRNEIVSRFERWLDGALASEEPPSGIAGEILAALESADGGNGDETGDYALWSAMTALTQEVKLQGRAFHQLNATIIGQAGRIAEELRAAYREREREAQRETERRCRKEAINAFIDLHDRLGRGLETARGSERELAAASTAPKNWLERRFSTGADHHAAEAVAALRRGYELGFERVNQVLEEFNAYAMQCQGALFDPRRMNAVEREESAEVAEGTVLEVYRNGYEWNGELLRPAQVKVACAPAERERNE